MLTNKEIKNVFHEIKKNYLKAKKSNQKIVKDFRYLLDNDAHETLGCKKTRLINAVVEIDSTSKAYLYRLLTRAIIESEIGVKPNTLRESWVRVINKSINNLDIPHGDRTNYCRRIWKYAVKKAGDGSKVKMPHIKEAIEYLFASTFPESEAKQPDANQQSPTKNKKLIAQLYKDTKSSHRKSIKPILSILKCESEKLKFYRALTMLNDEERNDLKALIQSDESLPL